MDYNIAKPSGFLSQYIKQYWSLENCMPIEKEHIQRIVPSGLFEMIFYFGNKPETTDPNKPIFIDSDLGVVFLISFSTFCCL